jgi:hypothetical protein
MMLTLLEQTPTPSIVYWIPMLTQQYQYLHPQERRYLTAKPTVREAEVANTDPPSQISSGLERRIYRGGGMGFA